MYRISAKKETPANSGVNASR